MRKFPTKTKKHTTCVLLLSLLLVSCRQQSQFPDQSDLNPTSEIETPNPIPNPTPNPNPIPNPTPPSVEVPKELTAHIEVVEPAWYTLLRQPGKKFASTSLTRYYAPHAVFFEGWKSGPRREIKEYTWDFGDGTTALGFNASHVYQNPGRYIAKLFVTTFAGAILESNSIEIEVLARDGKTYYVDSSSGDDTNTGLSPNTPWKTATHAFSRMNIGFFKSGDQILFKRGLTYDMEAGIVKPGHYAAGFGYLFGAFGAGAKPIIKHVGTSTLPMIDLSGLHVAFVTYQDLEFDGISSTGQISTFYSNVGMSIQTLFQRVVIRNVYQGIGVHAGTGANSISNFYLMNSEITNESLSDSDYLTTNLLVYFQVSRLGLVGNRFDYSNNHLAYVSWVSSLTAYQNYFGRSASGRTFLRVAAASGDFTIPSEHIYIGHNTFKGWVDPFSGGAHTGNGTRYSMTQINLGPNTPILQAMNDALVEYNSMEDAETFISIACYEDIIIRNNTFSTEDTYQASSRIAIGLAFERRPNKGVLITENTFTNTTPVSGGTPFILRVNFYNGPAYLGRTKHEDIEFTKNEVFLNSAKYRLVSMANGSTEHLDELSSNDNIVHTTIPTQPLFQINGTYNVKGTVFDLLNWQSYSSKDLNTIVIP